MLAGDFWVEFGPIWAVLEGKSGLALAPRGFEVRNVKMGKAESGAFFDFFHFFVETCPELPLFDPLFAPYACRCGDASAGVFPPFPSALLHAFAGPGLPKWQWKAGASDLRLAIRDFRLGRRTANGSAGVGTSEKRWEKPGKSRGKRPFGVKLTGELARGGESSGPSGSAGAAQKGPLRMSLM